MKPKQKKSLSPKLGAVTKPRIKIMNSSNAVRGIQSVNASLMDPKAVLAELGDAFKQFKDDQGKKVDKINSDITKKIETVEDNLDRLRKVLADSEFPGGGDNYAFSEARQKEHENAFFSFVRKGVDHGLRDLEVSASLTTQTGEDGGYAVPQVIDKEVGKLETDSLAMRRVAQVKPITTSGYRKLISAGGSASGWVGETDARPETATPILKEIAPTIGEIYANPAVTQTALDDVGFDVAAWLAEEIGSKFADQEGAAFITGDGVKKPKGILTYPTAATPDATRAWGTLQYVAANDATGLGDPDRLILLVHSLRANYRRGAVWMMNSKTVSIIRTWQTDSGEFVWRSGLEQGQPNTLLGYPVEEDENMPDVGAGAYPIAFGNFKRGYLIVDRVGIRVLRDPFTHKPFVHFYTTKRVGGCCQNFQAIKLLKIAAS